MVDIKADGHISFGKAATSVGVGVSIVLMAGSIASIFHHVFDSERHENDISKRARIQQEIGVFHADFDYPFTPTKAEQLDQLRISIAELKVVVLANQGKLVDIEQKLDR